MTGSVVFATDQGLGYLARDFYKHGIIDKVFVQHHSSRKNHYDWYPDRVRDREELLDCDTLFFFETPFDWKIIPRVRIKGIKTILMPMYECTNYPLPYIPDLLICPSMLDYDSYDHTKVFIPVPVDVPWKERKEAKVFIHNAGNGGLGGRNGTKELLEAMKYVKSPIKLIIRSQVPIEKIEDNRIEYKFGTFDNIWEVGDVFVFPEKFNGLSLPLQEAYASGLLVMASNRYPMNTWLPHEPLIPVKTYTTERIARDFQSAVIDPIDIAAKIDEFYGKDISSYSLQGKTFAHEMSWKVLKKRYIDALAA